MSNYRNDIQEIFSEHKTGPYDPGRGCIGLPGLTNI